MTYPEELDTDDIDALASYIERRYPTEEIRIHDTETIHFGYWDKSTRIVSATLLDHIQAAGYRVLYAGISTAPSRGTRRAWIECQKHDADGTVDEDTTEQDDITVTCVNCGEQYISTDAWAIVIFGSGDVRYTCPRCGHRTADV